jgi:Tfp pilus assembly protein PilV
MQRAHRKLNWPRGATLLESMVALSVLTMAFTLGAQMLGWSATQRRLTDERHMAMQEAANCLERVRLLKWSELTEQRLAEIELSAEAHRLLRSPRLDIRAAAARGELEERRIEVRITWHTRREQTPLRVQLVTWRYPAEVPP